MEISELVEEEILKIISELKFSKYIMVLTHIINNWKKFILFVTNSKKRICIIGKKDIVEMIKNHVKTEDKEVFVFYSDEVPQNTIILFYE